MKRIKGRIFDPVRLFAVFVGASIVVSCGIHPHDHSVARAFETNASKVQVEDEGIVTRLLADDTSGIPHQRFIVRVASGQTVLIEHNTDIAPSIKDLKVGDTVSFFGEYIWNQQGGLVHWTHHDPDGRHETGWLKHNGRVYQ